MTELEAAKDNFTLADVRLEQAYRDTFPVNSQQLYTHGQRLVQCIILEHGYGYKIKVSGLMSGREYWVHGYRFAEQ